MPLSAVFLAKVSSAVGLLAIVVRLRQEIEKVNCAKFALYCCAMVLLGLAAGAEVWFTIELAVAVLGPRPSLMMARESGTSFVCQPLAACIFSIAAWVATSQWPLGAPVR